MDLTTSMTRGRLKLHMKPKPVVCSVQADAHTKSIQHKSLKLQQEQLQTLPAGQPFCDATQTKASEAGAADSKGKDPTASSLIFRMLSAGSPPPN